MKPKYAPLTDRLAALADEGREVVDMAFADIAGLVRGGLPPGAYDTRQWWANSTLSQARAWRAADWHVAAVDFSRQRVRFERGRDGRAYTRRAAVEPPVRLEAEPDMPEVDVRVRTTWRRAGEVALDGGGGLLFPPVPPRPGLYRLTFSGMPSQERPAVYVGESGDLRGRFRLYRTPGPTQQTNVRLNDEMINHLRAGGRVVVAVATEAEVEVFGEVRPLSFRRKSARVAAEHAALAGLYLDGSREVVNRDPEVG
ncbi:hypothetical protein AB0A74_28080 [Saccharothrix sp. NPDC042600]|uniref:DUF7662 domain-containing protein n=1 Tax=Saccharothrix TaxID=2071 RepID=UPI00340D6744|nr:hypothetical protein GCM10017745_76740 [Saccharothrix mutabilis subsp. capreolus]